MSDETVTIEVDGRALSARKGAMLIEATDAAGIYVPRFCYHEKLTVAANCRMCLVEVEKAPKPLPACATPVIEGMKVFTRSERAVAAQRGTMEFLLINHPLDCPICDQGGECELQDLAMGYGAGVSRYTETKRVVFDKDIGPLVATDMTRCIHCTRCVRFGEEIAGLRELGATGRGEDMRIGTFVERAMVSELSGNVIDLCPVGALTAKPSRYRGRSWEMLQRPAIAPHDCVGSNLYCHVYHDKVMRVVPREAEAINEVWLSDRDRFSYEGLYGDDRLQQPMLRDEDGRWQRVEWEPALAAAAAALRGPGEELGCLAAPTATLEELYLLQKLARGLGCENLDHRLRQNDFSDQHDAPVMPWLGGALSGLGDLAAALVVGGNLRKDQPLAAHRLRKAAQRGARISVLNVRAHALHFEAAHNLALSPAAQVQELAGVAAALAGEGVAPPAAVAATLAKIKVKVRQQEMARALLAGRAAVLLGSGVEAHPWLAPLRAWAGTVAQMSGAALGYLPAGANGAGAWLAGCLPHRGPAGAARPAPGHGGRAVPEQPRQRYLLLGVEPEFDCADPVRAAAALRAAQSVVALTTHTSELLLASAQVLLPLAAFAETDGTYVNAEGRWQGFRQAARAPGDARPGWKVLRVLANRLELEGFDYLQAAAVSAELQARCRDLRMDNRVRLDGAPRVPSFPRQLMRVAEVPIHAVDMLVRRAAALQRTADGVPAAMLWLSPQQAAKEGLGAGEYVRVSQGDGQAVLQLAIDPGVAQGCAWIAAGVPGSQVLGAAFGPVSLERA